MRWKAPAKSLRLTAAKPPVDSDSERSVRIESFCSSATVRPENPARAGQVHHRRLQQVRFRRVERPGIDRVERDVRPHQRPGRPAHPAHDVAGVPLHLAQHVGLVVVESLAEQQQRLAASRDPLQVAGQRLERAGQRQRSIGALAVAGILAGVHRDRAAHARRRLLLAIQFDDRRHHLHAGELVDRGEQPRLVGGEILRRRRQRAGREHAGVIVRADVVLDELPGEGLDRPGASRADVMAVEHEHEHA